MDIIPQKKEISKNPNKINKLIDVVRVMELSNKNAPATAKRIKQDVIKLVFNNFLLLNTVESIMGKIKAQLVIVYSLCTIATINEVIKAAIIMLAFFFSRLISGFLTSNLATVWVSMFAIIGKTTLYHK